VAAADATDVRRRADSLMSDVVQSALDTANGISAASYTYLLTYLLIWPHCCKKR